MIYQKFTKVYLLCLRAISQYLAWVCLRVSLPNIFDVRLPEFIYQNLVNAQPWL